jgi:hypothetical protein
VWTQIGGIMPPIYERKCDQLAPTTRIFGATFAQFAGPSSVAMIISYRLLHLAPQKLAQKIQTDGRIDQSLTFDV